MSPETIFEPFNEHCVLFKPEGTHHHTKIPFGISPTEFCERYERLREKYGLNITKFTYDSPNPKYSKMGGSGEWQMFFIFHCWELKEKGVDITELIKSFEKEKASSHMSRMQEFSELAALAFIYTTNGYDFKFCKNTKKESSPDFTIDSIPADLKIINSDLMNEAEQPANKTSARKSTKLPHAWIANKILYKLFKGINGKGIRQGKMLFVCGNNISMFSMISDRLSDSNRIIPPKEYRVVFYYCTNKNITGSHYSDAAGEQTKLKIVPPNFVTMWGTYVDFEPFFWNSLAKLSDRFK